MTSDRQFCLFPKRSNKLRSSLHGLEPIAGERTDFPNRFQAQVSQFTLLHVCPDIFDRVKLGCIRRQSFQDDLPVQRFNIALHHATTVSRQSIPNDEQFSANLILERLQEFHEMWSSKCTGLKTEVKVPKADTSYH